VSGTEAKRLLRTPFHAQHVEAGAKMVDFGGWDMPVQYPSGIISEHLATRSGAGLFDVSHMGRFVLRGPGAAAFLQHVLTGNAEALDLRQAQYTMVPTDTGGAVDDAYLYRFVEGEYLLVVNASNRHKDWDHFREHLAYFPDVEMSDETGEIAMVAVQGKASRDILGGLIAEGALPEPLRNELSLATLRLGDGRLAQARIARTGYTGEPVAFAVAPPRAGRRSDGRGDAHLQLPAGDVRGQLLPAQGGLHRPPGAAEAAARLCAHPAARLLLARGPPAAHAARGAHRPRHRP